MSLIGQMVRQLEAPKVDSSQIFFQKLSPLPHEVFLQILILHL